MSSGARWYSSPRSWCSGALLHNPALETACTLQNLERSEGRKAEEENEK